MLQFRNEDSTLVFLVHQLYLECLYCTLSLLEPDYELVILGLYHLKHLALCFGSLGSELVLLAATLPWSSPLRLITSLLFTHPRINLCQF